MSSPESRLAELGISLPTLPPPLASYVPAVRTGNLLYISGQLPMVEGKVLLAGRLGDEVDLAAGVAEARRCAINVLAVLAAELGSLQRVRRVVRLTGFIASAPGFHQQAAVMNGASDLIGHVFGDAGRHSRAAVGVAELPLGAAVEVDAIVEIDVASEG